MSNEALCDAAETGDLSAITRHLLAGADLNWRNPECWCWTAL